MSGVSIDLGPSRKGDATFWRDRGDAHRLIVNHHLGGCALFLGVPLISLAAWLEHSILVRDTNWSHWLAA